MLSGHKVCNKTILLHLAGFYSTYLQEISDDGARLRTLLFLSRLLRYPGSFIHLPCLLNHDISRITEFHLKMQVSVLTGQVE
jgi:hypothetical protein